MLVIAFDGMLFDSLDARTLAVVDAFSAEGINVAPTRVRELVAGRSLGETVRVVVARTHARDSAPDHIARWAMDETTFDLVSLRAHQAYGAFVGQGFALRVQTREFIQRAASVTRIVVRADSRRREVDALLQLAGLEVAISMTRCSDDPGTPVVRSPHSTNEHCDSLLQSYAHITQRLAANARMLGERSAIGVALEAGPLGQQVARETGFETAASLATIKFPGL